MCDFFEVKPSFKRLQIRLQKCRPGFLRREDVETVMTANQCLEVRFQLRALLDEVFKILCCRFCIKMAYRSHCRHRQCNMVFVRCAYGGYKALQMLLNVFLGYRYAVSMDADPGQPQMCFMAE